MQLLAEMDGFNPLENISIIAATNRMDIIDEALLRPGRFDRIVEIPLPDLDGVRKILEIHTRGMNLHSDVDLNTIAYQLEGRTGADIAAVCTEAGMFAIRAGRGVVKQIDFQKAVEKMTGKRKHAVDRMYH
jgi:proteasome regulatory subunit